MSTRTTFLNRKLAVCVSLGFLASAPLGAQMAANLQGESSQPTKAATPHGKPIDHQWNLTRLNGSVELIVLPNGQWTFTGSVKDHLKGEVFDVTFVLKSRDGKIFAFRHKADASNGVQFSRGGDSTTIADDFSNFKDRHWSAVYTLRKNDGQILNIGQADERKLDGIQQQQFEARQRHDEPQVAKKKREAEAEAKAELQHDKASNNSSFRNALEQASVGAETNITVF